MECGRKKNDCSTHTAVGTNASQTVVEINYTVEDKKSKPRFIKIENAWNIGALKAVKNILSYIFCHSINLQKFRGHFVEKWIHSFPSVVLPLGQLVLDAITVPSLIVQFKG